MPILATLRANIAATVFGVLAAIFALVAVVQSVKLNGFLWIDGVNDKLEDCKRDKNELRGERDSLIAANEAAKRLNQEQVKRIVTEQEKINGDIEARYRADRERMQRELADRLRRQTNNGNPSSPQASPDVQGSPGTDAEARVCIPTADYVRGAETELQLDTIITLLERQMDVKR